MSQPDLGTVTMLLNAAGRGDASAREELYGLVYEEMMKLARGRLAMEPRLRASKAPESLVHEVYLRLVSSGTKDDWICRRQFYGYARRAMWQICVEAIRTDDRRGRERPLSDWMAHLEQRPEEIVALDDAMSRLAALYPRQ